MIKHAVIKLKHKEQSDENNLTLKYFNSIPKTVTKPQAGLSTCSSIYKRNFPNSSKKTNNEKFF